MDGANGGEFLNLTMGAARVGITRKTLAGRVRAGLLPAFSDPRNQRYVLLRVADLEAMATPRPRPVAAALEEATVGTS